MNQNTALLLGYAARKIFPNSEYFGSGTDSLGFFCEFSHLEDFQDAYIPLIENAMKEYMGMPVDLMEMAASNAKELFAHHGFEKLADRAGKLEGVIQVVRWGDFVDFFEGSLKECRHFSLLGFVQKKERVKVYGSAFSSEQKWKTFLKKYRQYPKKSHEFLAKKLDLYEDGFWHPRGMQLRQELIAYWRKMLRETHYEEIEIVKGSSEKYFLETKRKRFGFWKDSEDQLFDFEKEATSVLQFIKKCMKIFDFEVQWILLPPRKKWAVNVLKKALEENGVGYSMGTSLEEHPRIEMQIQDGLGRYHTGPYIQLEKEAIRFALFGKLTLLISLLLEKYEGEFPFWLCPEQAKLLTFQEVNIDPVVKILDRLDLRYSVDDEPTSLGEKMHRALRMKVPYVIIFGKREEKTRQVSIRAYGSKQDSKMTYEKFETYFFERKRELENQ